MRHSREVVFLPGGPGRYLPQLGVRADEGVVYDRLARGGTLVDHVQHITDVVEVVGMNLVLESPLISTPFITFTKLLLNTVQPLIVSSR